MSSVKEEVRKKDKKETKRRIPTKCKRLPKDRIEIKQVITEAKVRRCKIKSQVVDKEVKLEPTPKNDEQELKSIHDINLEKDNYFEIRRCKRPPKSLLNDALFDAEISKLPPPPKKKEKKKELFITKLELPAIYDDDDNNLVASFNDDDESELKFKLNTIKIEGVHNYFNFSVDLFKATAISLQKLDYLYELNEKFSFATNSALISYSFLRYRQFLLLKSKIENNDIACSFEFVPPPDVQLVHQTHIIRQPKFRTDLIKKFGKWFDHFPISRECYAHEIGLSEELWKSEFSEPYEPQFTDEQHVNQFIKNHSNLITEVPISVGESEVKEDLGWIKDCKEHFPDYHSDEFIFTSILKYKLYLLESLEQRVKNGKCVEDIGPPIDTDASWHAHQLCGRKYDRDLKRLLGFVFYHIPNAESATLS